MLCSFGTMRLCVNGLFLRSIEARGRLLSHESPMLLLKTIICIAAGCRMQLEVLSTQLLSSKTVRFLQGASRRLYAVANHEGGAFLGLKISSWDTCCTQSRTGLGYSLFCRGRGDQKVEACALLPLKVLPFPKAQSWNVTLNAPSTFRKKCIHFLSSIWMMVPSFTVLLGWLPVVRSCC